MSIRKATKKDLKEIGSLMIEEFTKPPFNEKITNKDVLKSLHFYFTIGKIYVSIKDQKIIGVIVFKIEQYWEGPVIIIEDLAVQENFKKQHIGENLMDELEKYAKKHKITSINFKTHTKSPAIKSSKRRGYKIIKDVTFMEKKK